ncbi:hypothetical protein [Sorangium sp. So ce131]|uniref:hypothetical protein n=1 Tax=Sorangium sp. So ce131 TaxID=3133282 RepID=UPI003F610657
MSKATDKAATAVAKAVYPLTGNPAAGNAGAGHVEGAHGEHIEGEHAEPDRPNNARLFAIVVATLITLVVTVIFVNEIFKATMEREISSKVLEPPNSTLRGLRAMEQERLTRYQWASEKDGVVRIPVDQAVALTLKDYQEKRIGLPLPGAAPNPAKPEDSNTKPDEAATPNAESGAPSQGDGANKPADATKPGDAKPADATKPGDAKPADATKPGDAKPADATKPEGAKPQTDKPVKPEGAAPKPASPAPAAPTQ